MSLVCKIKLFINWKIRILDDVMHDNACVMCEIDIKILNASILSRIFQGDNNNDYNENPIKMISIRSSLR